MIYENPIVAAGAVERNAKVQTFVRFAIAKGLSKGHDSETMTIFESRWPRSIHLAEMRSVQKSTVAPMNTIDSSSAAPLAALKPFGDAFIEYLRPQTVIGRMQGFRTIPFNSRVGRATAGSSVSWSGQGVSAILGTISFDSIIWKIRSIRGICVFTRELAKLADPSAEQLIRQDLANATAAFMDQQFLDPNVSEVTDISPASITNGATEIASTGATLAAISADLSNLLAQLTTNFSNVYLIMKPSTALGISKLSSGSGGAAFPNLGAYGGIIWGIPVIVSDNVPADANSPAHKMIVAIDAAEIFLNDAGIELEASGQALLEMSTSPDSPRTASTTLVSLWQQNLIAVLVRRYVNWARRREGSVAILTGVPF